MNKEFLHKLLKYFNLRNTGYLWLKTIILLLFVLFEGKAIAQQGNVWTFGYHTGIDFNTNPPVVLKSLPSIQQPNSSASICDSFGRLLLYSDGFNVYNEKNQLITNGNGLKGSELSNQGVLIVPSSVQQGKFIILTLADNSKSKQGLFYSIADINSQSLTGKNILLAEGTFLNITVIPHINGKNQWIIAKKYPDTFFVFQMVNDNFSKPVKIYFSKPSVYRPEKIYHSYLTPSFDGNLLVESCYFTRSNTVRNANYASYVFFYSFDPATGQLANRQIIFVSTDKDNGYPKHQYNQAAFSPNDSMIYITDIAIYPRSAPLIQLNRYTKEFQEITSGVKDEALTAIKTGPDGKIYLTYLNRPYLAVIRFPNKKGNECRFSDNYMKINLNIFTWLSFPNNYFKPTQVGFEYQLRCDSTVVLKSKSDSAFFSKYVWIFPNGDSAIGKTCVYKFGKSGWHSIKLRAETSYGYRQIYTESILLSNKPVADFGFDSNIACQWNEFRFKDLSKAELLKSKDAEKWTWYFGDGHVSAEKNPVHVYTHPGKYNITLIYDNGFCKDTIRKDSVITIIEAAKPGFTMSHTEFCAPYLLKIEDETRGIVYRYFYEFGDGSSDTQSSPSHFYPNPGVYAIDQYLTSPNGCVTHAKKQLKLIQGFSGTEKTRMLTTNVIDNQSIEIKWNKLPHSASYRLLRTADGVNYLQIAETQSTNFTEKNIHPDENIYYYRVIPVDACGRNADTSEKMNHLSLKGESSSIDYSILRWNDFTGWENGVQEYILEVRKERGEFIPFSSTKQTEYQDDKFFEAADNLEKCYRLRAIEQNGNHQESVSNEICLKYETFIYVPNAFSPNGDGINDSFTVVGMCIKNLQMIVMNYWGEVIFSSEKEKPYWDGTFKGEKVAEGPYVFRIQAETAKGEILSFEGTVQLIR